MIRSILMMLFAFVIAGCSTMKVSDFTNQTPTLLIEEYFVGETIAYGVFENRSGEVKSQFKVVINGTYEDNVLTLDEDFFYKDGSVDKRIWKIRKLPDGTYEGSADGVVGIARGEASGNAFNWVYVFDLPVDDTSYKLKFDDWMFLQEDGVLLNRAHVTKWGFNVGSVTLSFYKP
ncbi:hypothetical protein GCM10017044_01500 [Kordiimonas sediminis]|uniref:DUF3833 domain-containing protein n=1 Tax=Kordiimonas sediminis TaxID=1735581 RepID=A0A919E3Y1_9PROT|nr:DUF3833 domain-containing protein [Kordiimonas sediminis]GHF11440.1 hypothetical protein GCM10017044_01500 [Kordiimonas sediminis]